MKDQADRLREIIYNLNNRRKTDALHTQPYEENKECRVITITSGKGGVGKTNVSANLALILSQMGYRTIIIDADFGLANVNVLFGISPPYTLLDIINSDMSIFDIICEAPLNVKFISGGSGIEEMVRLEKWQLELVISKIESLEAICDIIIIDTGAGISESVSNFILAADDVILITTPEPTSIVDAYALVKTVANRDRNKDIHLLVNRAENEKEATAVMNNLCYATSKFLNMEIKPLGYMMYDLNITKAVKQQEPFILSYPKSLAAKQMREVANKLICLEPSKEKITGIRGFFTKLTELIRI